MTKPWTRMLRYALEALIVYPLFGLARLLPLDVASAVGAKIGDAFYLFHGGTARARHNLQLAMPGRASEHDAIVRGVWRNMGRVLLEYAKLGAIWKSGRVTVIGGDKVQPDTSSPVIFVGIHQANWEIGPMVAARLGWKLATIYRPLNNPFIDPLLRFARRANGQTLYTKSAEGAMALLRHVRAGGSAAMLVDQRLGDGIEVPFFGHPALTAPMASLLAVKYGAILVPIQIIRNEGTNFTLRIHDPVAPETEGKNDERVLALTTALYKMFEGWITEHPDQWLWMHDRWRPRKPAA